MGKILKMARAQFLLASLALFILGAVWATLQAGSFSPGRLLLGYLVILPAHLAVSYSNDYFDVAVDALGRPTFLSGGGGVLVDHAGLRRPALWIAIGLTACSFLLGGIFMLLYPVSPWFPALVAAGNLSGWIYSAPPFRLAYRGLGEISSALTSGFLVPCLGYLAARGSLDPAGLLLVFPLTLYGLAFLLAVEIPDLEVDRQGRKRTWVARLGRGFGFAAIGVSLLGATLYWFGLSQISSASAHPDLRLLALASLPALVVGALAALKRPEERPAAIRMVYGIIASMAVFFVLADGYLVYLVIP
jgi:1,4-dihydroxy-2-naphthoate octaprenyltransferase